MTTRLHVANGTSTTTTIPKAGIAGALSIWADPLHEGPVPAVPDESLLRIRAEHLAGSGHTVEETVAELRRWRAAIEDHGAYDELVLWYEHDLFDQLNLIQVLARIGPAWPAVVSLICIGSFPGRPAFKGLGELTAGELGPLFDTRQVVTLEQFSLAARAWTAFRADTPLEIEAFLQTDSSPLPFLSAALWRLLEELPWTSDGLSRSERRLLDLAGPGPLDLRAAFPRMHDGEQAFYIADTSFLEVARGLATASPALITMDEGAAGDTPTLRRTIALTDVGRDALQGREDRVRRCGIERWLGGVRLSGNGPLWRWDAQRHRVTWA